MKSMSRGVIARCDLGLMNFMTREKKLCDKSTQKGEEVRENRLMVSKFPRFDRNDST